MYQKSGQLEVDFLDASVSLEDICREFSNIHDYEQYDISMEAIVISMEENVYGGRPNAAGLATSGAVNYVNRMHKKAWSKAGEVVGKTARGEYGIIAKAKAFASTAITISNDLHWCYSTELTKNFSKLIWLNIKS